MLATDEEALICDMAETYQIYDMESLPVQTVAILASGLRGNSRIKMKMTGSKYPDEILFLAHIADRLGLLVWQNTKDGRRGIHRPDSFIDLLTKPSGPKKNNLDSFATPEDFWKAREAIIQKGG